MVIQLTEEEDALCGLLDQCTRTLRETEGIETSCRIAGGWVRDKVCSDSTSIRSYSLDLSGYVARVSILHGGSYLTPNAMTSTSRLRT